MQPVTFKILVVDEDPDDLWMLDQAFKDLHFEAEVKKFLTGNNMLQYLNKISPAEYPSVIVLDTFMPGMDVRQVLTVLKHTEGLATIPVILYTTSMSPATERELKSLGVYASYEKGFTQKEIRAVASKLKAIAESHLSSEKR